jgi:molecular chaperone GrpE
MAEETVNAGASDSTDSAGLRSRIEQLESELEKERNQATDYMKRWQYAQAELANLRRRSQQEREETAKYAAMSLAGSLLEVLDNFERAEQSLPRGLQSLTWIGGVFLVRRQLDYVLQQHGVEVIVGADQAFDPAIHEAIAEEEHDTIPSGKVIAEVQRGYRMHGRLLRPALVRVSKGPRATPAESAASAKQSASSSGGQTTSTDPETTEGQTHG